MHDVLLSTDSHRDDLGLKIDSSTSCSHHNDIFAATVCRHAAALALVSEVHNNAQVAQSSPAAMKDGGQHCDTFDLLRCGSKGLSLDEAVDALFLYCEAIRHNCPGLIANWPRICRYPGANIRYILLQTLWMSSGNTYICCLRLSMTCAWSAFLHKGKANDEMDTFCPSKDVANLYNSISSTI